MGFRRYQLRINFGASLELGAWVFGASPLGYSNHCRFLHPVARLFVAFSSSKRPASIILRSFNEAWSSEGLVRPKLVRHLQNQLQTKTSDWHSLVQAYKQIWPAYG